jgi:basic membrane protein A
MFRKVCAIAVVFVLILTLAAGCQKAEESDKVKVGFIYVGPAGDKGWSYAHDQARLYLEEQLDVETIYQENVAEEDAAVEAAIRNMIDQGCSMIFTTSFGFMNATKKMALEFPEVKFLHCSGYEMADNMSNYFGRMYQPRYLSGIVAGLKTESKKIGYVAAFDIPEVVRGINAFALGVQAVNPDAQVIVRWTNTWYDPAKEKDAALALLDEGCDVIAQHQDTPGPMIAAQERGKFAIGYHTDSRESAPKAFLTAPVWDFGPYYVEQVQNMMNGTWKAESYWGGMETGIVGSAELSEYVPEAAKQKVEEMKKQIIEGKFDVFTGPIYDQNGNLKVKEGQKMTDEEMLSFDWFVKGVVGKIG